MGGTHRVGVERRGIEVVPAGERYGTARGQFWVWAAANLSMLPVGYGVFVVGLGLAWWQAVLAILIALAASYPLVGLIALAGSRTGVPTMKLSRAAFGHAGARLPMLVTYASLIGWEIVSLALGALATRTVLGRLSPSLARGPLLVLSFLVMAGLTILLAVYGYHLIQRVQRWITLIVGEVTLAYLAIQLAQAHLFSSHGSTGSLPALLGGITLAIAGTGLGWVAGGADYSRYLPADTRPRSVIGWTALGGGAVQGVLLLAGVLLSTGDPGLAGRVAKDPIGGLTRQLPTWFLVPYLLAVVLSIVGAAVVDLYSSGIVLQALGVRLPRPAAAGLDGVLMIAGAAYVVFFAPSFFTPFQAFLFTAGSFVAAWAAVFLVDMLLHRDRGRGYDVPGLDDPAGPYRGWNWPGVGSMLVGAVLGLGLITSADPRLDRLVGFLLPEAVRSGPLGSANIGVVVAFFAAGLLYAAVTSRQATAARARTRHTRSTSSLPGSTPSSAASSSR
ncbi:purine-cytosine permease family protein [Kutzneria albida]|uniref:Permease for cytosine/purines uracil thiamine allantoin n=1 Tax=Kutzneria albida DSM 43870 TaxID=1449976 RepID=W5W2K7_9PSEU|nr:cytosine permease [Kutzneria albida]AHH94716.1 permease for cytosine/purines uracil thiamine allantoin [Kutzneria albida DSM 43870]